MRCDRRRLSALISAQQFLHSIGIAGFRAGITRGKDTRSAAQSRDDETGIVGQHGARCKPAVVEGFSGGVFGEGWRGFLERRNLAAIWATLKLEWAESPARTRYSRKFSRIRGGDYRFA